MLKPTRNLIILAWMLVAVAAALLLRPQQKIADQIPNFQLGTLVPGQFADWVEIEQPSILIVDPRQTEMLNKVYSQTLNRTYRNSAGYQIMLSLAYSNDQRSGTKIHNPEVCYPAQGFSARQKHQTHLNHGEQDISVTRVIMSLGQRIEPVTYWITVGNEVVSDGFSRKMAEISHGLGGKVPDGMLIRLSSIDRDEQRAYAMQARFAQDFLQALPAEQRVKFIGTSKNGS